MNHQFSDSVSGEKAFVQQLLDEYAASHSKIASRLRYGADGSSDPSLSRLIQAFSFLTARTKRRIDDKFPEILVPLVDLTDSTRPMAIPSMTTVEFVIDPSQAPDADGMTIPRGTVLESDVVNETSCRFQTRGEVTLWPINLSAASLVFPPFAHAEHAATGATCALRLSLNTLAANVSFDQLSVDVLRFFIHSDLSEALSIHQALFKDCLEIGVRLTDGRPEWLGRSALRQAGLDREEKLLHGSVVEGERLLSEFFCFPEKFLCFELHGLRKAFREMSGTAVAIDIYLSAPKGVVPRKILPDAVRLNCCPAINLFSMQTTPMELKERTDRLVLQADPRNSFEYHVHALDHVYIRDEDDLESELPRFHTLQRLTDEGNAELLWEIDTLELSSAPSGADTVPIRFVDSGFNPLKTGRCTIHASATCSNGDLPQQLSFGDDGLELHVESLAAVSRCQCLSPPTRLRRFALDRTDWNRISEILPDSLTLTSDAGAAALRAAARLFTCDDEPALLALIESIVGVKMQRVSGIVRGQMVCHGVDIELTFRRSPQFQSGHLLFALVLRQFMSTCATQGTFFRMRAAYEDGEELTQWPMTDGGRFVV